LEGRAFHLNRWFRAAFEPVEKAYRERGQTDFSTSVLGKLEPSLETNGNDETRGALARRI
jgi:hypothetical protein